MIKHFEGIARGQQPLPKKILYLVGIKEVISSSLFGQNNSHK